jgi:hypothetical protein
LGVWSTREPAPFPRIIELAATMAIGETSEPLETVLGFEIVQRIAVDSRPAYAMTAIKVHFIPDAPHDHAASKESAFARATSIVAALREKPSRFDEFQRVECCPGVERWTLGRGDPELTEILEMTPLDGLAPRPVVVDYNWVIAKRLQPVEPPDSETRFDLPAPANPDLDYLVRVGKPSTLAKQVTRLGDLTKNQLGLSPDEEASFDRLHREMASKFEMSGAPDERERILATVLRDVEAVLGAKKFQMYMTLLKGAVAEMLLKN